MYQMDEGIAILNEETGEVGTALEYTYTSFLVYRYSKEPNAVMVRTAEGKEALWHLKNCRPHEASGQCAATAKNCSTTTP